MRHHVELSPEAGAERQRAISAIHSAFAGITLGDGVSLHEADVIDSYGSDEERAAARMGEVANDCRDVPPAEATVKSLFREHIRLLDADHHRAVRQFLEWLALSSDELREDAAKALDLFWRGAEPISWKNC